MKRRKSRIERPKQNLSASITWRRDDCAAAIRTVTPDLESPHIRLSASGTVEDVTTRFVSDEPDVINLLPNSLVQPLVLNKKFISNIQPQQISPCASPNHLDPVPPSDSVPANTRLPFISDGTAITQLPSFQEKNMALRVQAQHATQSPVRNGTNKDYTLLMLSEIVRSNESAQSNNLSSIPLLDEIFEDFMHPISF